MKIAVTFLLFASLLLIYLVKAAPRCSAKGCFRINAPPKLRSHGRQRRELAQEIQDETKVLTKRSPTFWKKSSKKSHKKKPKSKHGKRSADPMPANRYKGGGCSSTGCTRKGGYFTLVL